jgi:hypothetical protein
LLISTAGINRGNVGVRVISISYVDVGRRAERRDNNRELAPVSTSR